MDKVQAEQDIKLIREVMEQSAKYMHFSGLSGAISGILALVGCWISYVVYVGLPFGQQNIWYLVTWVMVLAGSISQDLLLAQRKARRHGQSVWGSATYRLVKAVLPGVHVAFVLSLVALYHGELDVIPAIWALGYGVALCSAGLFTVKEVRIYGIIQLITGTIGLFVMTTPPYSLYLLALCFGVYQIIYGIWVTRRYGI